MSSLGDERQPLQRLAIAGRDEGLTDGSGDGQAWSRGGVLDHRHLAAVVPGDDRELDVGFAERPSLGLNDHPPVGLGFQAAADGAATCRHTRARPWASSSCAGAGSGLVGLPSTVADGWARPTLPSTLSHGPWTASPLGCDWRTLPAVWGTSCGERPPARINGVTIRSKIPGRKRNPSTVSELAGPTLVSRAGRSSRRTMASATRSGETTGGGGRPWRRTYVPAWR